jgi:hypothetical protein
MDTNLETLFKLSREVAPLKQFSRVLMTVLLIIISAGSKQNTVQKLDLFLSSGEKMERHQ